MRSFRQWIFILLLASCIPRSEKDASSEEKKVGEAASLGLVEQNRKILKKALPHSPLLPNPPKKAKASTLGKKLAKSHMKPPPPEARSDWAPWLCRKLS